MGAVTVTVVTNASSHSFYEHVMKYGSHLRNAASLLSEVYNQYGQVLPMTLPVRRDIIVFTYRPEPPTA